MSLTNDEEKCLQISNKFLEDAAAKLGFISEQVKMIPSTSVAFTASMVGPLAADKYRDCMQPAEKKRSR